MPPGETPPDSGSGHAGPTPPGPGGRTRSPVVVLALVAVPVALLVAFFVVSAFLRL